MWGKPYAARIAAGGLRKSKDTQLAADVAGVIESVGRNVTELKPGDEVFGLCKGAFAEYACASESSVAKKPNNVTFEQAASVPVAAVTALQGLRDKGHIKAGYKVLINGAAGGVGTFGVQIAKSFGADVTGVCSTRNMEMVRSIGADRVIDYTKEDFTKGVRTYDLILDSIGNHLFSTCRHVLNAGGILIWVGGKSDNWMVGLVAGLIKAKMLSWFVRQKATMVMTKPGKEDLTILRDLMNSGKIAAVIDRCYPLNEVAEAIRYVEQGHARGKVIITLAEPIIVRAL